MAACLLEPGCASWNKQEDHRAQHVDRTLVRPLGERQTGEIEAIEQFGKLLAVYRPAANPLLIQSRAAQGDKPQLTKSSQTIVAQDILALMVSSLVRVGDRIAYVPGSPSDGDRPPAQTLHQDVPAVVISGHAFSPPQEPGNLSLRLSLQQAGSQVIAPHMQASIDLNTERTDRSAGNRILVSEQGYRLSSNSPISSDRKSPLSLMTDLGVVELLGRYLLVPYWRCIPGASADPFVVQQITRIYSALPKKERIEWMRSAIAGYGFGISPGREIDESMKIAIDELIAKFNFARPPDYLEPSLFVEIYSHVPLGGAKVEDLARTTYAATHADAHNPAATHTARLSTDKWIELVSSQLQASAKSEVDGIPSSAKRGRK